MEKLKTFLAQAKKYHFWILCVLLLGVVLYGWFAFFSEAPVSFQRNQNKVQAEFKRIDGVGHRDLASPTFPDDAQKKGRELKTELATTVEKLRAFQRPERIWPERLSHSFRSSVERLGKSGAWAPELLAEYKKLAPGEVDRLRELVGAATSEESGGIQWDPQSFKQLRDQYVWVVSPTIDTIFEAQEKLWVAQAMLRCVAEVNQGSPAPSGAAPAEKDKFNLPISAIELLEVGSPTARDLANETIETNPDALESPGAAAGNPPAGAAGPGGVHPGEPPAAPPSGHAPSPAAPRPGGAIPGHPSTIAGHGRKPAPGAAHQPASPAANANSGSFVNAIPGLKPYRARMRLQMDLNSLSSLLVALADQRLTVNIDYVHIENEVRLVPQGASAPGPAPMNGPAANVGPGRGPAAPGPAPPRLAGAFTPPAPQGAPGGPGAPVAPGGTVAPGGPEGAEMAAGPPLLVQVPRGAVVDIEATVYLADPAQVESLKVAARGGMLR